MSSNVASTSTSDFDEGALAGESHALVCAKTRNASRPCFLVPPALGPQFRIIAKNFEDISDGSQREVSIPSKNLRYETLALAEPAG